MDDWLVKADAPCFAADWYKTWPASIADEHDPGHYRKSESGTSADWTPLEAAE